MEQKKRRNTFTAGAFSMGILFIAVFLFAKQARADTALDVPFSIQIPNGAWVQPFKDACEETSLLMADAFYRRTTFKDKQDASRKILSLVELEDRIFGFNADTNAEVMTRIINDFMPFEARVVEKPTISMIKGEIDAGRLVLVPANGRLLPNPYFKSPGPLYHVVVIVGYDDARKEFITNDPATRHGKNFRYTMDIIMRANADWAPDLEGERSKVMVFTSPTVDVTAESDADNDGLSKKDEIALGTNLYVADTDGDGFKDGTEVAAGYNPLVAESKLQKPFLARTQGGLKIYWIKNGARHYVVSPAVMKARGWSWGDVRIVSMAFLNTFQEGDPET
ncbi:MAG: C39 family peptidase [Candidatus Magasanikbacteria bacterium]|nr:C39 family peptidase [Candidatus Magasanikbacteria bacterium]